MLNIRDLCIVMAEKGYTYVNNSNVRADTQDIWLSFSTGYNGRGDWFEVRMGLKDNDIEYRSEDGELINKEGITSDEVFKHIRDRK